jgi:ribosome-associated toxin RatA of RatAB toxin-antitoxin module
MDATGRLSYDLAVLVGKYDSYLKWKESNKIIEQEKIETKELLKNQIDLTKIVITNKNTDNNDLDIASLIDEI